MNSATSVPRALSKSKAASALRLRRRPSCRAIDDIFDPVPPTAAGRRPLSSSPIAAGAVAASATATPRHRWSPLSSPFPLGVLLPAAITPLSVITQQRRSLFIQTATTPNPESLKFIPNGRLVLGHVVESEDTADPSKGEIVIDNSNSSSDNVGVHMTRKDRDLVARSPLAKMIFDLDEGIKSVYLGQDFLTVTKYAEAHWQHLQTPIFSAIMDFYAAGLPAFRDVPEITDTTILDDDDEVVAMIKELLETRIRPAVQEDGGDIRYVGFDENSGIVTVRLEGSCVGCSSSSVTLKNGVQNMLMHYIPEVTGVVPQEEEEDEREHFGGDDENDGEVKVEQTGEGDKKMKSYRERLAAAGIPYSD